MRAQCLVIADDENLRIADYFNFETLQMENGELGRRVNAGLKYAARSGADMVSFVGSDDWMHIDLFQPLFGYGAGMDTVISGREITLVDTSRGVMKTHRSTATYGVIPWLIPIGTLRHCNYEPIKPHWNRGLDHALYWQLRECKWRFHDPHPLVRVDFKTDTNLTPYFKDAATEVPMGALREWYPADLVDLAEEIACP